MYEVIDCESRFPATIWSVRQLGLPKGFAGEVTYSLYVDEVMDASGLEESFVVDSQGRKVAYFAWSVGADAHHKGDILDLNSVVINPYVEAPGIQKFLSKHFKTMAKLNDCAWVSRCKHEDGTLRIYFKEV